MFSPLVCGTFSILITSPGETRYCFPPARITAYMAMPPMNFSGQGAWLLRPHLDGSQCSECPWLRRPRIAVARAALTSLCACTSPSQEGDLHRKAGCPLRGLLVQANHRSVTCLGSAGQTG